MRECNKYESYQVFAISLVMETRLISGVYICFIALTGTVFNGLVIAVFLRHIRSIKVPSIFILSCCVSGFLASSIAFPQAAWFAFAGGWESSQCKIHGFLVYFFGTVSMLTLGAVALEKYLTITKNMYAYGYFLSRQQAALLVLGLWLFSLFLSALPFAGWSEFGPDDNNITCALKWRQTAASDLSYFVVMFVFVFVVPVGVMVYSYHSIIKIHIKITKGTLSMSAHLRNAVKNETNKSLMLLLLIGAFLLAWTPYSVVVILTISNGGLSTWTMLAASLIAKTSFVYNPLLYAFISPNFRQRFYRIFLTKYFNNRIVPFIIDGQ